MKKAKIYGGFAAVLLAAATLTSCGGGGNSGDYDPDNFLLNGTDDNPYRIVKEPVTIKIFAPHSAGNPEYKDLAMFKHLSEITGLNFQFTTPDSSAYTNTRAGAWSSDSTIPDLFLFNNPISEIVEYAEKGFNAYVPLNDPNYSYKVGGTTIEVGNIIEKYMPYYKAGLDSNFGIDKSMGDAKAVAALLDGTMYSTLSVKDVSRDLTYKMFINQQWIDNINNEFGGYNGKLLPNADEVKTIEEYLTILRAFKELDANLNDDSTDEIPVTSKELEYLRNFVLASYGYVSYGAEINADKTAYEYVPYTEAYRNYLKFMNVLYKEGLLDKDTFSIKTDNQMALNGQKDKLGSFVAAAAYLITGYDLESNYKTFGPLTSSVYTGEPLHWGFGYFQPDGTTIPQKSKYVREVARLIDIMYSPLGQQLISYGVEGVHWTWDDEAHTSWTFNVPADWSGNQEQYRATITPNVNSGSALYWSKDFVEKMNDDIIENLNEMSAIYLPNLKVPEPQEIKMNATEYANITTIKAALDPQLKYIESCFVRGADGKDVDSDDSWNSFMDELKRYHADELLKCYNDALARYNA